MPAPAQSILPSETDHALRQLLGLPPVETTPDVDGCNYVLVRSASFSLANMSQRAPRISSSEALSYLAIWRHAATIQAIRILTDGTGLPDGPFTKQADCFLFTVAVRNVRRAGDLLRKVAPRSAWSQIDLALNAFDKRVPHATDLRDVFDHFDDYAVGKGNLQEIDGYPLNAWFESSADTYRYNVGISPARPLLTIDVKDACHAVDELSWALGRVLGN